MLANAGHAIQKILNNTPVAITVNEKTSTVVTNGGAVYQAGFIHDKIQNNFRGIDANIVGRVIDSEAVENAVYLLTDTGSVYEYDYNGEGCGSFIREVYSPAACGGDKAIKIATGRAHVLILTQNNKVWGAGNNEEYQLVPQGQCRYDTATEIIVTDTNLHDNDCCGSFTGNFNELKCPVIPQCEKKCNDISCVKDDLCDVLLGYLTISKVTVDKKCESDEETGTLNIPVFGDLSFVGFLCVDSKGCASGSVTFSITRIAIKCGCFVGKFVTKDKCGCHIKEVNISSTKEILIFESDNQCHSTKANLCIKNNVLPITGAAQINGKCGECVTVNVDLPCDLNLPTISFDAECNTITLELRGCKTSLTLLCSGSFDELDSRHHADLKLDFDVPLDCCAPPQIKQEVVLPQPCWANIYAGFDISVLVDNCNRLYVLGSLHNVRSNKDLLKRSCLEDLLKGTNASISFPADQLNCATCNVRNENCKCVKCRDKAFKTDLSKFGIHLSFPNGDEGNCEKTVNVCDFLQGLKRCNDTETCNPTCEPCDSYIYLNVSGECGCPCGAPASGPIGSVTVFNRRSICKLVSQGCPDIATISSDVNTILEFDFNKYCVDTTDVPLDKILKLDFCEDGPNVNIYIDIDQPGGIKFTSNGKKCNVDFTVTASTQTHQFLLNFGSILDPVELTNLKFALSLDCHFPCPKYKNPFDTKITNTYLKGGDHVKFVIGNPKNIRQAVTPDVPTVFRLNRRVLDVAVGKDNLTALVGGLACPNELFVIGNNCFGQLGLGNNESIVCWKQINRCIFDCQVIKVWAGKNVTFYATQSHHIYGSGSWKNLVESNSPVIVKSICQSWKIKHLAIAQSHIVLLGFDGSIFGVGDNNLGELGLGHVDFVKKPTPLAFFYKLNKPVYDNCVHPVQSNYNKSYKPKYDGDGYDGYEGDKPCNYDNNKYDGPKYSNKNPCGSCPLKKYNPNNRLYYKGKY